MSESKSKWPTAWRAKTTAPRGQKQPVKPMAADKARAALKRGLASDPMAFKAAFLAFEHSETLARLLAGKGRVTFKGCTDAELRVLLGVCSRPALRRGGPAAAAVDLLVHERGLPAAAAFVCTAFFNTTYQAAPKAALRVRQHVAAADDKAYAAVRAAIWDLRAARAADAWGDVAPQPVTEPRDDRGSGAGQGAGAHGAGLDALDVAAAFIFPEEQALTAAVLDTLFATTVVHERASFVPWLCGTNVDLAQTEAILARMPEAWQRRVSVWDDIFPMVVQRLDTAFVPTLCAEYAPGYHAGWEKTLFGALSYMASDAAGAFLASVDTPRARDAMVRFAGHFPARAVRVLAAPDIAPCHVPLRDGLAAQAAADTTEPADTANTANTAADAPAAAQAAATREPMLPAVLRDPPWRAAGHKKRVGPHSPCFVLAALPPLRQADAPSADDLPPAVRQAALDILAGSTVRVPHDALATLIATCTPASLEAFAWAAFEQWSTASYPARDKWALEVLAHVGTDETAAKLTPYMARWPRESRSAWAKAGIQVLTTLGTDGAVMALHTLSTTPGAPSLARTAKNRLYDVARARRIKPEALTDMLVHQEAQAMLEVPLVVAGATFDVVFTPELTPGLVAQAVEADGVEGTSRAVKTLPRAKADDAAGQESHTRWRALKKTCRAFAKTQLGRLERAMCTRQRWDARAFDTYIVQHPLLRHVASGLVWAVHRRGQVVHTVVPAEDGTLFDANDEVVALKSGDLLSIVHPALLEPGALDAWRAHFAAHERVQPFAQVTRVHRRAPIDWPSADVLASGTQRSAQDIDPEAVRGLKAAGWTAVVGEGGGLRVWTRVVGPGPHAVLELSPGIPVKGKTDARQALVSLAATRGSKQVALSTLGVVAQSEVWRDVCGLAPGLVP